MYQHLQLILTATLFIGSIHSLPVNPKTIHPDFGLDILQFTAKYGYPLESHEVQTEDGYILTLHRIPHGVNNSDTDQKRTPILLMHGLLSSSIDWINMGPQKGLGLLLADAGYDVWMGNARGTTWSRKHIELDPDTNAAEFYSFSWHEIGTIDLPAKIDYILAQTGEESLFYVGHSQGTTSFFVMASEKPEYNAKIRLMSALAPVAYMSHMPNPILKVVAENLDLLTEVATALNIHEFLPHYGFIDDLATAVCSDESEYQDVCTWILNLIAGFDWQVDPNFIPVIMSNAPAGSSVKQVQHYLQEVTSDQFCQYDYGAEENTIKYGQATPPKYDISKITAPVSLHFSQNDWLAGVEDVDRLMGALPNMVSSRMVPLETFNHLDFLWATDVVELVMNAVITEINATNN